MRKVLWIPAVMLLWFAGDRLFASFFQRITANSEFRYSRLYSGRGEADIVLLGNSRGLNFYQPFIEAQTGKSTLNLSYNAMPVDIGAALLLDYLDLYGAPERLIVDITFLDRDNDDLIRDFRLYAPFSERLNTLLKERDERIWAGTQFAHLSRYGGEVAQRMLYYRSRSDEDWLLDRQISRQMVSNAASLQPYHTEFNNRRIDLLASVAEAYKSAGAEVHFVINPYYPPFQQTMTNLDSLSAAVQSRTGIPVLDYYASVAGDQHFGDYQHLNKKGAELYLAELLKALEEPKS